MGRAQVPGIFIWRIKRVDRRVNFVAIFHGNS
jgi:hypothetical protein